MRESKRISEDRDTIGVEWMTETKTSGLSSTEEFGKLVVAILAGHRSTQDMTPWRAVQGLPWWSYGEGIRPLSPSAGEDNAACLPSCLSTDVAPNCRDIRSLGNKANVHARAEVYERPGFRDARLRGDNLLDTLSLSPTPNFLWSFPLSRNHIVCGYICVRNKRRTRLRVLAFKFWILGALG